MKAPDRTKILYYLLAGFIALVFLFFSYARVFDEFEFSTLDFRYSLRPHQKVNEDIVLIEISDDSIEKIGTWPFPRNYHGLLTTALKSSGAKTIIFDIFFSEEKDEDEGFAGAVKEAGNVYIPYVFEPDVEHPDRKQLHASGYAAELVGPLKEVAKGSGFVNVIPDADGKVRRIPPFMVYEDEVYPHLTFNVALEDLGYNFDEIKIVPGKYIIVSDDLVIPLTKDSSVMINYPDVWGKAFRHYSFVDIIQSYLADVTGQESILDLTEFKDSVCFIGVTATASPDAHPSPMESLYPGVGVHASLYNSIINHSFIRRVNRWWNILILIIMWTITALLTLHSRKRFAAFSIFIILAGFVSVSALLFVVFGIWIDDFYPASTIVGVYILFTFLKYIREIQKREILEKELDIAKGIQESFLPVEFPSVGNLEIAVTMKTARQVGGDLYDVVHLGENKLGVMLGDVSGKGVPAALYMSRVVSVFRTYVREGTAGEIIKMMNDRLCSEASSGLFVTLVYTIFDVENNTVNFAIGGHNPTLVVEPDGNIELLDVSEGMPIGMIESGFEEKTLKYKPGSLFVFYTDGVTEAMDVKEEMFEMDRLIELAKKYKGASPKELVDAIHKAVNEFEGNAPQHDDITVMVIRV